MNKATKEKIIIQCAGWHLIALELIEQKVGSKKAGEYYMDIILPAFYKLTETSDRDKLPEEVIAKLNYWKNRWK